MISGQSPESRTERRNLRHNEEIEVQLAQAALNEITTSFNENISEETDTTDAPDADM